jgi:hypothetical protein
MSRAISGVAWHERQAAPIGRPREDGNFRAAPRSRDLVSQRLEGIGDALHAIVTQLYGSPAQVGYVGALQCDPIEKKPFFHALPGTDAFSFGMLGCDLHCAYCQNWFTSQSVRDPEAVGTPRDVSASELAELAIQSGAPTLVSTYNEPLITSEWAVEIFAEARRRGLRTAYVSNGNGTPQVLDYIRPWVDFYKVDLKSMDDKHYRQLRRPQNVVAGIHERGSGWSHALVIRIQRSDEGDAPPGSSRRCRATSRGT